MSIPAEFAALAVRLSLGQPAPAPILEPSASEGAFDAQGVDCPFPFRHGGRFYLAYVGFDGRGYQTGITESEDLIHWENRRLLIGRGAPGSFREHNFALTSLLRDNALEGPGELARHEGRFTGAYHAYPEPGYEAGPACIGFCFSEDLVDWDIGEPCFFAQGGEEWERGGLYKSFLLRHEGTYYLFYNAKNDAPGNHREQIGLATSPDLKTWTRCGENPIVPNGPPGSLDQIFAADPAVYACAGGWVMAYYGLAADGHARLLIAWSRDLVRWTKFPQPIRNVRPAGHYDSQYAHKPGLIAHEGRLHHFYCAVDASHQRTLAVAVTD